MEIHGLQNRCLRVFPCSSVSKNLDLELVQKRPFCRFLGAALNSSGDLSASTQFR